MEMRTTHSIVIDSYPDRRFCLVALINKFRSLNQPVWKSKACKQNVTGLVPFWLIYLIPKAKETPRLSRKEHKRGIRKKNRIVEITGQRKEKCKLAGGAFLVDREPNKHKAEQPACIQRFSRKMLPYGLAFPW